jgi:hypothetical protein
MIDILLALHFLGLMMGAGGGFGSMIVMRSAATRSPEQAAVLRSLGPTLTRFAMMGLVLLWASGLALVWRQYGGFEPLPVLFWVKIAFVLTLTLAALATEFTYAQVKAGDAAAAARLPVLGPVSGASSVLAVVFAVFAFH